MKFRSHTGRDLAHITLTRRKKKDQEVVFVRKQRDLPLEMSVDDLEKSRKNEIDHKTWMNDETLSKGS